MQVCTVLGRKDLAHVLPRAEYLWLVGRYPDSYEHVARTLPGFPAEEPGLAGDLSRFYFNAVFRMDERRVDKYLHILRYVTDKKKKNAVDNPLFSRVLNLCLETDDGIPPREIWALWDQFPRALRPHRHGGRRDEGNGRLPSRRCL